MEQQKGKARKCKVPNCDATTRTDKLFRTPRDPQRMKLWMEVLGIDGADLTVFYICGRHFPSSAFSTPKRDKLMRFASPCFRAGNLTSVIGNQCAFVPQESDNAVDPQCQLHGDQQIESCNGSQHTVSSSSQAHDTDIRENDVSQPHSHRFADDDLGIVEIDVENFPGCTNQPVDVGHLKSPILLLVSDTDGNSYAYHLDVEGSGSSIDVSGVDRLPDDMLPRVEVSTYSPTGVDGNVSCAIEDEMRTMAVLSGPLSSSTPLRPAARQLSFGSSFPSSGIPSESILSLDIMHELDDPVPQGSTETSGSSVKAKSILSMIGETRYSGLTPRKQKLVQEVRKQRKVLGVVKKSLKSKTLKLQSLEKSTRDDIALVERFASMSVPCAKIMVSQIRNSKRKPLARRWKMEEKLIALALYKRSPRAYRFLCTMFTLPTTRTLVSLLNKVPLKPGINSHIFDSIKKTVETNNDVRYAYCALLWDEMSIKEYLEYVPTDDIIVGYADLGEANRSNKPAQHALVFMAVGLFFKWKQPLAFYFTPSNLGGCSLLELLRSVLSHCTSAGLHVRATICDGHSVNRKVYQLLGSSSTQPWFTCGESKIFTLFDPPHLLKCTRNMFIKHDLSFLTDITMNGQRVTMCAKWDDIVTAYEDDQQSLTHNMHKLTKDHIDPKHQKSMKVNLAAQIFSRAVTAYVETCVRHGVLEQRAVATAEVTRFFNDLFDSLNGYHEKPEGGGRGLRCRIQRNREDLHLSFWETALEKLKSMKFLNKSLAAGSSTRSCSSVTILGWIRTVHAVKMLWTALKEEIPYDKLSYLEPRRLNQDPLENLFGSIRSKCGPNFNPTAYQFSSALKTCLVNKLAEFDLKRGNCEAEAQPHEILENLQRFLVEPPQPVPDNPQLPTCSYNDTFTVPEQVVVRQDASGHRGLSCAYVCGFAVSRLLGKHGYDVCRRGLVASNPQEYVTLSMIESREFSSTKSGLTYPSRSAFLMFDHGLRLTHEILEKESYSCNLRQRIVTVLSKELDFSWWESHCPEHSSFVLESLSVSLCRIYTPWWCKWRNRAAKEARRDVYSRKMLILQHL